MRLYDLKKQNHYFLVCSIEIIVASALLQILYFYFLAHSLAVHHQELPCRTVSFSFSSSFSFLKSHLGPICLQNRMCVSSSFAHLVGQVLHEFKSSETKTTCLRRADE